MFFSLILFFLASGLRFCQTNIQIGNSYLFTDTIHLLDSNSDNKIGYQITSTVHLKRVLPNYILAELQDLQLHKLSNKVQTSNVFVKEKSKLNNVHNNPFLIQSVNNSVGDLYISDVEGVSMVNLKKSIASLLQIPISEQQERVLIGSCQEKLIEENEKHIVKIKNDCHYPSSVFSKNNIWSGTLSSTVRTEITLSDDRILLSVVSEESHTLKANIANLVKTTILAKTQLILQESTEKVEYAKDFDGLLTRLQSKIGSNLAKHKLTLDRHENPCHPEPCSRFSEVLKKHHSALSDSNLGTTQSALAALEGIRAAKKSTIDDIYNELKSKSNKKILNQIMDILGAVQTNASYEAALKYLKIDNKKGYNLDLCERYLWALSISPRPQKPIIEDLLKFVVKGHSDEKLFETLVSSLSSMTRKYCEQTQDTEFQKEIMNVLTSRFKKCKEEDTTCQRTYLKAFNNVGCPSTLDLLVDYAVNTRQRAGSYALKAILSIEPKLWTENVIKTAERIFLSNTTYHSSSRTLAFDIIIAAKPNKTRLRRILSIFKQKSSPRELKEYILQRFSQVSEEDSDFSAMVKDVMIDEGLMQYDALAQGGLSTAFTRHFMPGGYISTSQDVQSGILSQGYVHIVLDQNASQSRVFTLGMFSSGMGSFVSDEDGEEDNEDTRAGLELSVLGVEFRPFVFFNGHGELMGHVFSGTGSSLTPAYQALLLLGDDQTYLPIGGFLVEINFSTVASIDLSGKIEISLWNRNAQSLVQNRAGLAFDGNIKLSTPFIQSESRISLGAEPQLLLTSNIEFSGKIALCMQVEQPNIVIRSNSTREILIPETKHRTKTKSFIKIPVPGKTYVLNQKNNDKCNLLSKGL